MQVKIIFSAAFLIDSPPIKSYLWDRKNTNDCQSKGKELFHCRTLQTRSNLLLFSVSVIKYRFLRWKKWDRNRNFCHESNFFWEGQGAAKNLSLDPNCSVTKWFLNNGSRKWKAHNFCSKDFYCIFLLQTKIVIINLGHIERNFDKM